MKRAWVIGLVVASLGATGCQASYTSIRQVDATRYHVTRTKQGFFTYYGTILDCQARGDEMTCTEISDL
ncbi:hypothetical protein SOCEGT47_000620 [Sorangium cellulosum]|uniref:Secreted protein n=1 Tax=Sorangium cellulosum TaxID=56 RepID=A0A4P2PSY2_SORCE|nr:hypothetical protein [Sorangium cellulosum]AUX19610.1 hypothetical protein SOCEGT47_000620 [Sorangium cellulosum]